MDSKELGYLAENIAARYLEGRGYEVIEKNYRKPWGEIDIIACKDGVVVFIEVKANRQETEGFEPEVRVNWRKRRKIERAASLYLEHELCDTDCEWRIDVVGVTFNQLDKKAKVMHFKSI